MSARSPRRASRERFVATAVDTYGGLDIIVNNAGYTWDSVIQKMTDEQWDTILDLHLKAPFRILRAAQPVISTLAKAEAAQGIRVQRKVVNISSGAGVNGNAGQANYSSAKAGVIGLTKALDILTKAGVVGYRITWRLTKEIDQQMVARTTERGWSMHYLHRADEAQMDGWKPHILKTPGKFVLEHMGGVDPAKGIDGEGFKFVLQCLDTGRCWLKLSPRISKQDDFPFSDTDPLVKKLVEHAPNRLLWGSDWPHPQYFKPMPNDVALLDQMLDWVPDEKTRKLIFVDNPAEAFGFPPL